MVSLGYRKFFFKKERGNVYKNKFFCYCYNRIFLEFKLCFYKLRIIEMFEYYYINKKGYWFF